MKIRTWRDPYESGFSPTKPTEIELNPGLTVLVGCNGAGKTTLLRNIEEQLKDERVPVHKFDNLSDGGSSQIGALLSGWNDYAGDSIALGASLWAASEGEAIKINVDRQSTLYKEFLKSGYFKNKSFELSNIFRDAPAEDSKSRKRVLLFDATDSGMSIDVICEIKEMFRLILEDSKALGMETYIVISANEYELCREEKCFDVNEGKYVEFSSYEDYRNFILKSRTKKEKRIAKQIVWQENKRQKEEKTYYVKKAKVDEKIGAILKGREYEELSWKEQNKVDDLHRELKSFLRDCSYFRLPVEK